MQKKIIVLFPTWSEAKPFILRHGTETEVWRCGIGAVECAARTAKVIAERNPDLIILAGIAGSYDRATLHKGDTVLISREHSADLGTMRGDQFHPLAKSGGDPSANYYTNDTPLPKLFAEAVSNTVTIAGTPTKNRSITEATVENMEGAGFFAVCQSMGVRYAELRTISNYVGESPQEWIIPEATEALAEALSLFIGKARGSR